MGEQLYHAIVVTARYAADDGRPWIEVAHEKALEAYAGGFKRMPHVPKAHVSEPDPAALNGVRSFAILASGTDLNRDEADEEAFAREVYIDWLRSRSYGINEDGEYEGSPLSWVVVSYGADEHKPPKILADDTEEDR